MSLNISQKKVRLVEVGPRDGLQNEKKQVSLGDKVAFVEDLVKAGLKNIEVTSFVRADKIAQLSDAKEVFKQCNSASWSQDVSLACLVPNLKGLESAIEVGVQEVAVFTATSESFNKHNINASVDESLARIELLSTKAREKNIKLRGYISTVFGCPYEGETSLDQLQRVAQKLFSLGVYEISLGDTIGVAHPLQVQKICRQLQKNFDLQKFSMHFHDTRGRALANILASLDEGINSFDSSAGGLGGCPYAKGATGNVATEDVVDLLDSMGISTGVDLKKCVEASAKILKILEKTSASKAHNAFLGSTK